MIKYDSIVVVLVDGHHWRAGIIGQRRYLLNMID